MENQEILMQENTGSAQTLPEIIKEIENLAACFREAGEAEKNGAEVAPYHLQRGMINRLFTSGGAYDKSTIMLRLTVIDSLYSTNAAFSHFSIEEMAGAIFEIGSEEEAANYFDAIARGGEDTRGLFSKSYGTRKNLGKGRVQMSLLSKYAYYVLLQNPARYPLGFPIHDSLVCSVYERACRLVGVTPGRGLKTSIEHYAAALDRLRTAIFGDKELFQGMQQFDLLDAYLWRVGKLDSGNLSLLLNRDDYARFIQNLGLENSPLPSKEKEFDKAVKASCKEQGATALRSLTTPHLASLFTHWLNHY